MKIQYNMSFNTQHKISPGYSSFHICSLTVVEALLAKAYVALFIFRKSNLMSQSSLLRSINHISWMIEGINDQFSYVDFAALSFNNELTVAFDQDMVEIQLQIDLNRLPQCQSFCYFGPLS